MAHTENYPLPYKHQQLLVEQHAGYVGSLEKYIMSLEEYITESDATLRQSKHIILGGGTTLDKLEKLVRHNKAKVDLAESIAKLKKAKKFYADINWHFEAYFKPDYLKKINANLEIWDSLYADAKNHPDILEKINKDLNLKGYNIEDDEVKLYFANIFKKLLFELENNGSSTNNTLTNTNSGQEKTT